MNRKGYRHRGMVLLSLGVIAIAAIGCSAAEGIDNVKAMEKKVTPGMTMAQVEGILGKPSKVYGPTKGKDGSEGLMYVYTNFDKQWELEARFSGGKLTWTDEHDSTSVPKGNLMGGGG